MEFSQLFEKPEGTKSFPIYTADSLERGKVFAKAAMGFLGNVEYGVKGDLLTVKTSTERPVLATLGCQLAGWGVAESMISGPVRMKVKKPSFIYDKVNFGQFPELPDVACVEGEATSTQIINKMVESGIEQAEIIRSSENSESQYINILARAIEIALFRLSFITDINQFKITNAVSNVETRMNKEDLSNELNDAIRFHGQVTLIGDFKGFKDFEEIVTKNTSFRDQNFGTVMNKVGSVANCPLELFSVSQLTIMDKGKTRVF